MPPGKIRPGGAGLPGSTATGKAGRAPALLIADADNQAIVSSPPSATGWTTSGYTISTANGTNSITIAPPPASLI